MLIPVCSITYSQPRKEDRMVPDVTVVKREKELDMFRCRVADAEHRVHTVEIPASLLAVDPHEFKRGSDAEHIDIIACGTVLMRTDPDATFHTVDRSMVNRAYNAALRAQFSVGMIS